MIAGIGGAKKIFPAFTRNPLKRLDSDERIQESPRESKPESTRNSKDFQGIGRKAKLLGAPEPGASKAGLAIPAAQGRAFPVPFGLAPPAVFTLSSR